MRIAKILILALLLFPGLLLSDIFPKVGTAGLQFLKLGVDARAIGMGEAYTAVTDDISSVYWNPAGLALKPQKQLLFSHTQWVADIMYEYFAASKVTSLGTFAISASALHMPAMDVYIEESFDIPTGEKFYAGDFSAGLTYSSLFTDKFSFGFTAKYLRQNLDEYSVNGVAVDVGSLYNTKWQNLTIGMSLRNFGPDMKYKLDNDHDGQYDEDPFDLLDNDHDGKIDEDFAGISNQMFATWYTDDQESATSTFPDHVPLGLYVHQESYQWEDEDYSNFVGIDYAISIGSARMGLYLVLETLQLPQIHPIYFLKIR